MQKTLSAIAFALACLAQPSIAAPAFHNQSCVDWNESQTAAGRTWISGYVAGMDQLAKIVDAGDDRLSKVEQSDQLFIWMDNYCLRSPEGNTTLGAHELWKELGRNPDALAKFLLK